MPTPRIKGTREKIRVSRRLRYDPQNGVVLATEWAGAGINLEGYSNELQQNNTPHELTQNGIRSTILETANDNVSTGGSDSRTDQWEVHANENHLDVKEHPRWTSIDIEKRHLILADVNRHADGKPPKKVAGKYLWNSDDEFVQARQLAFYNIMIRGTSHFPVYNWVLRHTTNAPADFGENIADEGVGTVYTTGQLLSEISNNSYWIVPCPPRLREKIGNITLPAESGYTTGWLKKPSNESSAANNRINISTEYVFLNWPNILYV